MGEPVTFQPLPSRFGGVRKIGHLCPFGYIAIASWLVGFEVMRGGGYVQLGPVVIGAIWLPWWEAKDATDER
jgi:hypothetical protein